MGANNLMPFLFEKIAMFKIKYGFLVLWVIDVVF